MSEVINDIVSMIEKLPDSEQRLIYEIVLRFYTADEKIAETPEGKAAVVANISTQDLWDNLSKSIKGVRK